MFVRIAVCIFIRAACGTRTHNVLHGKEICYHCINAALAEGAGFEPTRGLWPRRFSRPLPYR